MDRIKLLLVDDQVLFVESLKTVLELEEEKFSIIGVAHNGFEALSLVESKEPDVVLLDVRMPELDGVEAVKIILKRRPNTKVIMLTTFDDDEYVQRALHSGAMGYLLKNIPPHKLIGSIMAVMNGSVLIAPGLATRVILRPQHEDAAYDGIGELSNREREILVLMTRGYGNKQIVDELGIAEQTVRNHVSMIYSKLNVRDRYEAVQVAVKAGLR